MSLGRALVSQFHRPTGFLGRIAGTIMAHRGSNLERNRWTVELLQIQADDVVCELGPGPGVTLALLLGSAGRIIAVDHSELMLERCAARHLQAVKDGDLTLYEASFENLPDIGEVDKMIAVNSLQFSSLNQETLAKLLKHLKPGGVLAVTFQPRGKTPVEADVDRAAARTRKVLIESGFASVEEHRLPLEPVSAVCLLARRSN